jgi:hypothetical protein
MSNDPRGPRGATRSALGTAALVLLPVLCCAGPALLGAASLGVIGSWLASPWLLGTAAVVVLAVLGRWLRHRTSTPDPACCPPAPHPPARSL